MRADAEICESARRHSEETDFRATSLETVRQMVAAGLGCTLLPALAADPARNDIATVPLANHAARRIAPWRRSYDRADDLHRVAETIRANLAAEVGLPDQ